VSPVGRRTIRGTGTPTTAIVFGPDRQSVSLASSMAIATNPFSPMAAGMHSSGTPRGYSGDPGYGVNRWAGRTPPLQFFAGAAGAVQPIADPRSRRLGIGAGAAGQPGLPGTGTDQGLAALGWLSLGQLSPPGMGG